MELREKYRKDGEERRETKVFFLFFLFFINIQVRIDPTIHSKLQLGGKTSSLQCYSLDAAWREVLEFEYFCWTEHSLNWMRMLILLGLCWMKWLTDSLSDVPLCRHMPAYCFSLSVTFYPFSSLDTGKPKCLHATHLKVTQVHFQLWHLQHPPLSLRYLICLADHRGPWALHGPMLIVVGGPVETIILYVHHRIKAFLSPQYCKSDNTVASLIVTVVVSAHLPVSFKNGLFFCAFRPFVHTQPLFYAPETEAFAFKRPMRRFFF